MYIVHVLCSEYKYVYMQSTMKFIYILMSFIFICMLCAWRAANDRQSKYSDKTWAQVKENGKSDIKTFLYTYIQNTSNRFQFICVFIPTSK